MQKILEQYCLPEGSKGLLLLSMPTGSGKTYTVLNFIYTYYREFAAQGRKILYITNLKKNLPAEDLKKRFNDDGKTDIFDKHVLFINSNSESVIHRLLILDCDIPDQFKTLSYSRLKSYIETLEEKSQLPKSVKSALEEEIRKKLEPAFRKFVTETLYKEFKSKKERLFEIKYNTNSKKNKI